MVGTLINLIPLLNILDANPDTSPVMPPPIEIKQSIKNPNKIEVIYT